MSVIPENVLKVKEIFEDYYGEDRVDLQEYIPQRDRWSCLGYPIVVWFPQVIITNEYGKSTTARDLFVKTGITREGKLACMPIMARSTFTFDQACSRYRHSHCSGGVPTYPDEYGHLCFGTGPINSTMSSLMISFDEGLWTLFCGELDLYTKTESVVGVPYKRLEHIGGSSVVNIRPTRYLNKSSIACYRYSAKYRDFIKWLLEYYDIPIVYHSGVYSIAMPLNELILLISEAAIEYEGQWGRVSEFSRMHNYFYKNGNFYRENSSSYNFPEVNEHIYVTFKGQRIPLKVLPRNDISTSNSVRIIDNNSLDGILSTIYWLINFKYDKR